MKKIKRWKYYCDYCKKSSGSGRHISRHEKSCTLNPNRICNVCLKLFEIEQKPIQELLSVLPDGKKFIIKEEFDGISYGDLEKETEKCMPKLRDLTENCPACIMAALRQAHIPVPMIRSFDFTTEMKSLWADINQTNNNFLY